MIPYIIIGGGVAGLSAALTLAKALKDQDKEVLILEAKNRLGGRVCTIKAHDGITPIELGATFWEGSQNNPFYKKYIDPKQIHFLPFEKCGIFNPHPLSLSRKHFDHAIDVIKELTPAFTGKPYQDLIDTCYPPSKKLDSYDFLD